LSQKAYASLVVPAKLQYHVARRDQRSVDDKAGIAFDLRHVPAIVVNPMTVEVEGGLAEEQDVVRDDLATPWCGGGRGLRRRRDVVGALGAAVNDVVELDQRRLSGIPAAGALAAPNRSAVLSSMVRDAPTSACRIARLASTSRITAFSVSIR
jgi:hypothetical protein